MQEPSFFIVRGQIWARKKQQQRVHPSVAPRSYRTRRGNSMTFIQLLMLVSATVLFSAGDAIAISAYVSVCVSTLLRRVVPAFRAAEGRIETCWTMFWGDLHRWSRASLVRTIILCSCWFFMCGSVRVCVFLGDDSGVSCSPPAFDSIFSGCRSLSMSPPAPSD